MRNHRKFLCFAIFTFFLLHDLFSAEVPIKLKADEVIYDGNTRKIFAEGDVEISSGEFKVKTEKLEFDIDKQYIVGSGSVTMIDGKNWTGGTKIEYSLLASTGYIYNAYGYFDPWYFSSETLYKDRDIYILGNSKFTTCDKSGHPHYVMLASKATIKVEKNIQISNAKMHLGVLPVVYLPWYSYPLKKRSDCWEVYPGYNSRDGITAKIIYGFPLTLNSYTKLYLDWFSKQNTGIGLEYNYSVLEHRKGTIYAYHIKDDKYEAERWTVKTSIWQKLTKTWSLQGNINFQSDKYFNKDYFGENWNRNVQELKSDIAFTKQTRKTNWKTSISRIDKFNPATTTYYLHYMAAPQIEFALLTFKHNFLPFYVGFNGDLAQRFSGKFSTWTATGDFYITRQLTLSRNTTLTPKVGITEFWEDKTSLVDVNDLFLTRLYSTLNFRQRLNQFTNFELAHNFKLRSKQNVFEQDLQADDYGIETNNLQSSIYISPKSQQYLRISSGYELRNFRNSVMDRLTRFQPIITDLQFLLIKNFICHIIHQQRIKPSETISIQTELNFKPSNRNSYGLGIFYHHTSQLLQLKTSLSFWLTSKWQLSYYHTSNIDTDKNKFKIIDEELKLYRDLHCWEANFTYRRRGELQEYFFNIGLKIAARVKSELYDTERESEHYPWRKK
ncbi:MAG: hypothetical protein QME68_03670 [Elusimicrobiota bacterium]|nr:hypothetical protein [Elusimicrobiota bacterium]